MTACGCKALDALKPMAGDPRVTKTLSQVLLTDVNPAMRMQAPST